MKKADILYYMAIFGVFCINLIDISKIINIESTYRTIIYIALALMLVIKIIFTKYSKKQIILIALVGLISCYSTYVLNNYMFIINFLAIVGIKGVNIKTVVKIDIIVKLLFILIHTSIYFYDYINNYEKVATTFVYTQMYGIRHGFYFSHPNTAGGIAIWLAIDIIYVYKNKKMSYIISSFIVLFFYYFTGSRTMLTIYMMFLVLIFVDRKNPTFFNEKTNIILRYLIDILAISSILLVLAPRIISNTEVIDTIDKILSRRLYYSDWAINLYGFNIFPNADTSILDKNLIVDNFYIRCIISYGIIIYLMLSAKFKLVPKNVKDLDRIILIILPFYLFNELFCYNIGRAIALLVLANAIFNKKENGETDECKEQKEV